MKVLFYQKQKFYRNYMLSKTNVAFFFFKKFKNKIRITRRIKKSTRITLKFGVML